MSQTRGLIPSYLSTASKPLLAVWLLGASACTGEILGSAGDSGPAGGSSAGARPGDGNGGSPPVGGDLPQDRDGVIAACAAKAGAVDTGRTPLRRLTRSEIDRSLSRLLGVDAKARETLTPDERMGPFFSNAVAPVDELAVTQFSELAERVALAAATKMQELAGCNLESDAACPAAFIGRFGRDAYRGPLEPSEVTALLAVFDAGRAAGGAAKGFQTVVSAMLQSPFFLYHDDTWTAGGAAHPSAKPLAVEPYVLASRLAFFLLGHGPDGELLSAAGAGRLAQQADIDAQVARLLTLSESQQVIGDFHRQWLGLGDLAGIDRSTDLFPMFGPELIAAAEQETELFANYVLRQSDGRLKTLLTSSQGFPSGPLFGVYGANVPAGHTAGAPVQLDAGQRFGILTQAAFLMKWAHAEQTSPVHRGIVVRENLLCGTIHPPPANLVITLPAPSEVTTTRQRFAEHVASPACGACHKDIDPLGLAFEHYDSVGRYRTNDGLSAVDASGAFTNVREDLAGTFSNAGEMVQKLAESSEVKDCASRQWFRFALGRVESFDDACTVAALQREFDASQGNVKELLSSIARSEAFRHVRSAGEAP
jgi:hypothetical protein